MLLFLENPLSRLYIWSFGLTLKALDITAFNYDSVSWSLDDVERG